MDTSREDVILVDENDRQVGTMEKLEAHEKGVLHRAFSIFLFNKKGEMLLQKRALGKYHTPGLWTNTCCSHPRADETMEHALQRKLNQEMGINCPVQKAFQFLYKAELESGLTEHELDHVFYGYFDENPNPNPDEVVDWKYSSVDEIREDFKNHPKIYTPWFKIIFERMTKYAHPKNKV